MRPRVNHDILGIAYAEAGTTIPFPPWPLQAQMKSEDLAPVRFPFDQVT